MRFFIFLLLLALCAPLSAHATRTVTSPYVDQGVLKLKWKGGFTEDDKSASRDGAWQMRFTGEYGITDRLSFENEYGIENAGNTDRTVSTVNEFKLKALLAPKGSLWLDPGARLTYGKNLQDGPDFFELKLIGAKDTEKFRHIANIILTRQVGEDADNDYNGGFSWSSRYKWKSWIEPGFELYDNFGSLSSGGPTYSEQDHSIGPVFYGKLGENVKYEAGYLAGISDNASDDRYKLILEYGITF